MTISDDRPAALRESQAAGIQALFRSLPTLGEVARDSAQRYLDVNTAPRRFRAAQMRVGTPRDGTHAPPYSYQSLPDMVMQRFAAGRPLHLVTDYHIVEQWGREQYVSAGLSLATVEALINQCGAGLLNTCIERLQDFWREQDTEGFTRWGRFAQALQAVFDDVSKPAGTGGGTALFRSVHVCRRGASQVRMLPLLLLRQAQQSFVFSLSGGLHSLSREDDIQVLLAAYLSPPELSELDQWFTLPVQGEPFQVLAVSYLAWQLDDIRALDYRMRRSVAQYQALFDEIIDPRRWFARPLTPVQLDLKAALPLWLAHASEEDTLACARLLQQLAQIRHDQGTRDFLQGIASIRQFADERLQACLKDLPQLAGLRPAEIEMSFDRVVAAAVPMPGGFIAGEVEHVTVSLTDLALENLAGFPYTARRITLKGKAAPASLTYTQLKACVTAADVGRTYPALLKSKLRDDAAEVASRQSLFSRQWRIQLPLLALELKIKGLHGLTGSGAGRVLEAVQASDATMAFWQLAFKTSATAAADEVTGHFIIGPRVGQNGPHLLYCPLMAAGLQEYASIAALFEAIKAPGPLQDQVLTWIAPQRRSVYANGGFLEPHIRRFLPGDEFGNYEKPAPAQLEKRIPTGDPAVRVFTDTVTALVELADRESVSNAEQRWALLKKFGWLMFGTLLPYLPTPLMLGGWLVQLMDSVQEQVSLDAEADEPTRTAVLMNLLVNLAAVLLHQADAGFAEPQLKPDSLALVPAHEPISDRVSIEPPPHYMAPGGWANASNTLTPALRDRIAQLRVTSSPVPMPEAQESGLWRGLLRDARQTPARWYGWVDRQLFRVRIEQRRVRVIGADGNSLGPWLEPVGDGRWRFDLQLRLRGGADHKPPVDKQSLENQYRQASLDRARAGVGVEVARTLMEKPAGSVTEQQRVQARESYTRHLQDKVNWSVMEVQLLKQLRDLGPRPGYEEALCQALESVILSTRLLDTQIRTQMQAINDLIRPLFDVLVDESAEESEAAMNVQAHAQLRQGMRELAAIHEQAIHWRTLEQGHMEMLEQVPKYGRDKARALNANMPQRPSALDLQSLQLTTLWGIAIDVPGPPLEDEFFAEMSETINRARRASRSLADLDQVPDAPAERIELLDSIDRVFALTDDRIEFWRAMEPSKFDLDYLDKLQHLLTNLHQKTQKHLSDLLQPAPEPGSQPAASAAGRRKRIIRTRNRDLYVARSTGQTDVHEAPTAEVRDAEGKLIGTFSEAEDGVWDLKQNVPASRPDPELGSLMKKGEALLVEDDRVIAQVEAMVDKANDPRSLQELLEAQARSRQWVADSLGRKLRHLEGTRLGSVQHTNTRAMLLRLQAAVARLEAAGLAARVRATRNRPVTQEDIAFLHAHHEVRITRQGQRVKLKGHKNDYLQVYQVSDAHTGKALCYAHFHYERVQGPDDHFTAAHLKSPEQERLGRLAQGEAEAQAFASMRQGQTGRVLQTLEIRRSQIQLPLARQLFFSAD